MKNEIQEPTAKSLVDMIGPSLGCDFTYEPVYPKSRRDVCAVRRLAENGSTYGYDTIYLIWRPKDKDELKFEALLNSKCSKDYIHIDEVVEDERNILIKVYSGGSYSGSSWNETYRRDKRELSLE